MSAARGLKARLKTATKKSAMAAGALLARAGTGSRILTYHSVGQRDHEMNVAPKAFRRQMAWLAENTTVIPLSDAARGVPGVAITFDDGYADNLHNAAPVLREFHLPATIFMVAGMPGGLLPHDRHSPEARLLTWEELRGLRDMGFAVGAHGMTHRRLAGLDESAQRFEIFESKHTLERELDTGVTAFAYPYGSALDYDCVSVRLAQEAGYGCAASNRYGPNAGPPEAFALRRVWVDRTDTDALFQAKVAGRLDVLRLMDSAAGIRLRRTVNRLLRTA